MKHQLDVLDMGQGPLISLSDQREQNRRVTLALAIAEGKSITDAAAMAGMEFGRASQLIGMDETLWIDVAFALKRQAAVRYAPGALATLVAIHEGEDMPAYARIAAARTVLELADLVGNSALKWKDQQPRRFQPPGPHPSAVKDPEALAGDVRQLREQIHMLRQALNGADPRPDIDGDRDLIAL